MINIKHPKTHGKPPVYKSTSNRNDIEDKLAEKEDCDSNVVDSTAFSIERLCDIITDLEKNIHEEIPRIDARIQLEPEKDTSEEKYPTNGTTYEDIMSFLSELEDAGPRDLGKLNVPDVDSAIVREMFNDQPYLDRQHFNDNGTPYAFEEDLATARLQLEEKNAAVSLLKEQLKSERKLACDKLEGEKRKNASRLHQLEEKYKGIVKRHQKFIEQLIREKTDLTEKCNSLVQRIKETETKLQRDLKAAADRHVVELQKAKERQAAAEKIRRERWIEARTTKIKEMTVKGLEPELRNMMEQHAEEIQRLRNVHMKELQDVELRTIRRSNQQLDQLRLELTASHERMLTNEKNILWARYTEKLQEQEDQFKTQQAKLLEELQLDREKFNKERSKWETEKEATLRQMNLRFQREIEALNQRHSNEKKFLEESLKGEWEAWLSEYKRQQTLNMKQAESKIRDECDRVRDREIELAIERLEKDSREEKLALQQNSEQKIRSLTEKYETDLQTAIDDQQFYKSKLTLTKEKLENVEIQLQQMENKAQRYLTELNDANQSVKQLSLEKEQAKKLARQEIEGEKRELEEKIASLYQEISRINAYRDASMAQLHSRVKLIMTQKVLTIRNLTKELTDAKLQCERLEKLLDQQRRDYHIVQ